MTEKVLITQEQADAIKYYLATIGGEDSLLEEHAALEEWDNPTVLKGLNKASLPLLAKALYIGYEIETEFKVGDWVVRKDGEPIIENYLHGTKIHCVQVEEVESQFIVYDKVSNGPNGIGKGVIRHATDEEIKQEKERRLWKSIDREVGEFRLGDVYTTDGQRFLSFDVPQRLKSIYKLYNDGKLKGFYPTESFIFFVDGEES